MDIRLPRLGEGADSGTVASIFVKEGDQVKKDQPILELESEKAVASIPAPESGTVSKLHVREGDTVKVGQLILTLTGGSGSGTPPLRLQWCRSVTWMSDCRSRRLLPQRPRLRPADAGPYSSPAPGGPPPAASPTIRKMARELGIDLRRVKGSERGGRIVMDDLRRYVSWLQETALKPARGDARGNAFRSRTCLRRSTFRAGAPSGCRR